MAVGAKGTTATINRLRELGYQPIELERGSTGYKIWKKLKIKRVRVPDILCLRSGLRFESRGKTKLEISMSHSKTDPRRAWDADMRNDDFVAVVLCEKNGERPVDWEIASPIHFIKVQDMRDAFEKRKISITEPKGADEGSEIRVIWPSAIARKASKVISVSDKTILLSSHDLNEKQKCILPRKTFSLHPVVREGENVAQNQIVAAVVPIDINPVCEQTVDINFFVERLHSASLSERYSAAKALRFIGDETTLRPLTERMLDEAEDIYVRLEAAAALAAKEQNNGWSYLSASLNNPYPTIQLETVIVLSEIVKQESQELLIKVLIDNKRDIEVRAGAAWALGEFKTPIASQTLIDTFSLASLDIKVEAARALLKIAPAQLTTLIEIFKSTSPSKREGIAWALAKAGGVDPSSLLSDASDTNLRQWVSYIVGFSRETILEEQIASLLETDPEVHFAASVLWQLLDSWIYNLNEF